MGNRKTHLINQDGDKKVVETRNSKVEIQQLNESTSTKYQMDIEWYLSNGYVTISDARKKIEGNGNNE